MTTTIHFMKTTRTLLVALPLAILVTGCEQKKSDNNNNNLPATNSPATETTAPPLAPAKTELPPLDAGNVVNTNLPTPTNNAPATNAPGIGNQ
jgi:hypothetical protein